MLLVSQAANGALSARRLPTSNPNPNLLFSNRNPAAPRFPPRNPSSRSRRRRRLPPPLFFSSDVGPATSARPSLPPLAAASAGDDDPVLVGVGDDGVRIEGVIQLEKPDAAEPMLVSYAKVGFLAGGDVLCLLVFSAIGRLSHGMPVLDLETLKTADPFIAGWLLSAYFLGAFGDDAKGSNGLGKAVVAAAKSWAVGIPLGIAIRAATSGHIPPTNFILVAMGSTGILLIAWRTLASKLLSSGKSNQNDVYRHGSPFELFELLTSLVRRW